VLGAAWGAAAKLMARTCSSTAANAVLALAPHSGRFLFAQARCGARMSVLRGGRQPASVGGGPMTKRWQRGMASLG